MSDRTSSPLVLGDTLVPRAAVRAWLAVTAGMGALATALLLMLSVASNSGGEAERITETQDDVYSRTLVSALAVNFSRPLR